MDDSALAGHLSSRYGVEVSGLDVLDLDVHRVDCADGRRWVARVLRGTSAPDARYVESLLRRLAERGFPAERCAAEDAVSELDGAPVLITDWVDGERSDGRGHTFGYLGALLGRLHAHSAESAPAGGAWHHLAHGDPSAEVAAAITLMDDSERLVRPEHHDPFDQVYDALHALDLCRDLPHALVHPDFTPANAITTPSDGRVIVDWAGAGRGPRLWSLAFMLWAAGCRDLRLVDVAFSRYARHVELDDGELARLAGVIPGRPLTLDVWAFSRGRVGLPKVVANLRANREVANRVSARVQDGSAGPGARDRGWSR